MYEKVFRTYSEASDGLLRLSLYFLADSHLRNIDKACDKIDHSESC